MAQIERLPVHAAVTEHAVQVSLFGQHTLPGSHVSEYRADDVYLRAFRAGIPYAALTMISIP